MPVYQIIPAAPLLHTSPLTLPTAQALLSAVRTYGFFYLTGAPFPSDQVARIFAFSARFFAQPLAQKEAISYTTAESNRGYAHIGREKASQGFTKEEVEADRKGEGEDMKESLDIGREGVEAFPNRWPEEQEAGLVGFRETMLDFFERCRELHSMVMRGIALGMGLPADFFDPFVADGDNTLRLLHYPAASAGAFRKGKCMRAGAHTDFGSLTFLFQDDRGGLQVEKPGTAGLFIDVQPIEGAIVVNSGDLLARWSNDLIRSTVHRVVEPPKRAGSGPVNGIGEIANAGENAEERNGGEAKYPPRYSIAYFCNPDFDDWVEALPGTWGGEKGPKKYERVKSGDYLTLRLDATY